MPGQDGPPPFGAEAPPPAGGAFGKYQSVAALGRGGMADVFLALARGPLGTDKLVVVKRLRADLGPDPRLRAMFLDEARLAVRLNHPNVVQTYEAGEAGEALFMAMEYLEGQPLHRVALAAERSGRRVDPLVWARVVADVLAGLEYAHELCDYDGTPLGVVHRDVTPHNVFLTYEGQVKLVDFGVAKAATNDAETEAGVLKGKASYMAPEQVRGEPPDARVDVFAAGVILWELVAGRRLFYAGHAAQTMHRLLHEPAPSLSDLDPGVDPALARAVAGALVKDPAGRFPSARALREALLEPLARPGAPSSEQLRDVLGALFAGERDAMRARVRDWVRSGEPSGARARSLPPPGDGAAGPASAGAAHTPLAPRPAERPAGRPPRRRALAAGVALAALGGGALAAWPRRGEGPPAATPALDRAPAPGPAPPVVLRLQGSNTIGAELGPALAEGFWRHKGFAPSSRREGPTEGGVATVASAEGAIEIRAAGTARAFADLASGACDLGMASRRIHEGEGPDPTVAGGALAEHVLALEGIAVVVHPDNPVAALSLEQARDLFTGRLADWSQVPGAGERRGPVRLYGRDEGSGTLDTFRHVVLDGAELPPSTRRLPSNQAVVGSVLGDAAGLGFAGLAAAQEAKPVAIADGAAAPMLPSTFTVETEDYPLARRLYLYAPARPATPLAHDFVAFALSDEGQAIVRSAGFVGLNVEAKAHGGCAGHCPPRYRALTRDAKRLSLTFRFRNGGADLDERARRDFDRLLAFLRTLDGPKLMLLGFSDDLGPPGPNAALARQRARRVADELRARGVEPHLAEGFGPQMPVASNETEAGRRRNRRVEVWLAPPAR